MSRLRLTSFLRCWTVSRTSSRTSESTADTVSALQSTTSAMAEKLAETRVLSTTYITKRTGLRMALLLTFCATEAMFSASSVSLNIDLGPGQYEKVLGACMSSIMTWVLPNEPKNRESMIRSLLHWLRISLLRAVHIFATILS